jgi:hypothetical protein
VVTKYEHKVGLVNLGVLLALGLLLARYMGVFKGEFACK